MPNSHKIQQIDVLSFLNQQKCGNIITYSNNYIMIQP